MNYFKHKNNHKIVVALDNNGTGEIIHSCLEANEYWRKGCIITNYKPFSCSNPTNLNNIKQYLIPLTSVRDWLRTFPSPYKELALKRYDPEFVKERGYDWMEADSLLVAIHRFCNWEKTPEGGDFWHRVYCAIQTNDKLPEIPGANNKQLNNMNKVVINRPETPVKPPFPLAVGNLYRNNENDKVYILVQNENGEYQLYSLNTGTCYTSLEKKIEDVFAGQIHYFEHVTDPVTITPWNK